MTDATQAPGFDIKLGNGAKIMKMSYQLRCDVYERRPMKLSPVTPALQPLTAAHLLIHAERGNILRPGSSVLGAALRGLRARYTGSGGPANPTPRPLPLQLQVDDLLGQRLHAVADAGHLTDLSLPAGTYQVAAQLGNYRRSYTMTLEPGTSFHLHLHFGKAGH